MNHRTHMERCLELARRAFGCTAPNPLVGAVLVKGGRIVGEGWHRKAGDSHAEVVALQAAGEEARGATLYVNLEPCCHHGRTPPCTEAIIAAGVTTVVAGMVDPHDLVNGRGVARLRDAGVHVEIGCLEERCRELNAPFILAVTRKRPWITLKAACSLDGRIAMSSGESRWITGEEARRHGHELRTGHDGILVGSGTALSDDPRLDCRLPGRCSPVPVLLDTHLRVPPGAAMFHGPRRALVYTAAPLPGEHPADVVRVPPEAGVGVHLPSVLADLACRGVHSLLVEGGGRVHGSFLTAGLADRVVLHLAPKILGDGPSWVTGLLAGRLEDVPRFTLARSRQLGQDLVLELHPAGGG